MVGKKKKQPDFLSYDKDVMQAFVKNLEHGQRKRFKLSILPYPELPIIPILEGPAVFPLRLVRS